LQLTGEQMIAAPRERVWDSLNDPEILWRCIPGCEEVVRRSETEFEAKMLTKIGPLRARFSGRVEMRDIEAPSGCTLFFEDGANSMGRGHSKVTLEEITGGTLLRYDTEAAIGGKLGQIGGRLIDASAQKMADEFFRALNSKIAPKGQPESVSFEETASHVAPAPRAAASQEVAASFRSGWSGEFQRLFWFALGAGLGGAVGYLLHVESLDTQKGTGDEQTRTRSASNKWCRV
jgi:carbon monoxide dehydrogenase subunit G